MKRRRAFAKLIAGLGLGTVFGRLSLKETEFLFSPTNALAQGNGLPAELPRAPDDTSISNAPKSSNEKLGAGNPPKSKGKTGEKKMIASVVDPADSGRSLKLQELTAVVSTCLQAASECKAFCVEKITAGENDLAACFQNLQELIPICETIVTFSYLRSSHIAELCQICAKICTRTKRICDEFRNTYPACATLADAAEVCRKKCRAV